MVEVLFCPSVRGLRLVVLMEKMFIIGGVEGLRLSVRVVYIHLGVRMGLIGAHLLS